MHLDDVARGARLLRHDRHVAPGERIERLDLPALGGPAMHHAEAVAETLAAMPSSRWRAISACSASAMARALPTASLATSASSEKSIAGLDQRRGRDQLLPPALVELPQRPFRLASA